MKVNIDCKKLIFNVLKHLEFNSKIFNVSLTLVLLLATKSLFGQEVSIKNSICILEPDFKVFNGNNNEEVFVFTEKQINENKKALQSEFFKVLYKNTRKNENIIVKNFVITDKLIADNGLNPDKIDTLSNLNYAKITESNHVIYCKTAVYYEFQAPSRTNKNVWAFLKMVSLDFIVKDEFGNEEFRKSDISFINKANRTETDLLSELFQEVLRSYLKSDKAKSNLEDLSNTQKHI